MSLVTHRSYCDMFELFTAINAVVSITTQPDVPSLEENITLSCSIITEELLNASGIIFLQLPNGTILSDSITSAVATLVLMIDSFTAQDEGKYYCNASVTSPEFPDVGLRVFEGIDLEILSMCM